MNTTQSIAQKALQDIVKSTVLEVLGIIEHEENRLSRLCWQEEDTELAGALELQTNRLTIISMMIEDHFGIEDE